MISHKGMRPQDVVVVLKLISLKSLLQSDKGAYIRQTAQTHLAVALGLSQSEISGSLQRSRIVRLVGEDKREVYQQNFLDFLFYGLRYVFPAEPGPLVVGMPTAHSAEPLRSLIVSQELYVWPDPQGSERGQAIEPLYNKVPYAARQDERLYELLALTDALRVGRAREIKLAQQKMKDYIYA
ncbi:hypothetical protein GCM10022408_09420 [Hymenobacter fastidiosus]|uniref:XRE family transcriptional regulator n=2 Tax=Hymenobacter fastidiosus TaxID=486264 RepID=A0ABP7RPG9_9BACT